MSLVLVETHEGIATVTLNRPDAMNALSTALRNELADAFRSLEANDDVAVVILTGAGRAFCAGLDLKELGAGASGDAITDGNLVRTIESFSGPVIGAINGFAITGGFELALACDVLVASSKARFADTHARVGILPGWGLSQKLSRIIGIGRAKRMSFTGNFVGAEQAAEWGLVTQVVAPDDLIPTCRALASEMTSCDPLTLKGYKRVIDEGFAADYGTSLRIESRANAEHAKTVSSDAIAERRRAIQARGREQAGH
ncbi:MAG: enoyl-CoA hydratase [Myxococcales bacterium]|nr:enoyl-CoA hydratase [Myxococcales bacterium]